MKNAYKRFNALMLNGTVCEGVLDLMSLQVGVCLKLFEFSSVFFKVIKACKKSDHKNLERPPSYTRMKGLR